MASVKQQLKEQKISYLKENIEVAKKQLKIALKERNSYNINMANELIKLSKAAIEQLEKEK